MQHVEIRVKSQIDPQWSEWFGNLAITSVGQEQSLLTGIVPDQAALYGILQDVDAVEQIFPVIKAQKEY